MFAIIVPKAGQKVIGCLQIQSYKDFKVYLKGPAAADDILDTMQVTEGGLPDVKEEFTIVLEEGTVWGKHFLSNMAKCIKDHPEHDVYHADVEGAKGLGRTAGADRIYEKIVAERLPAPLSSFVFRTLALRTNAVLDGEGSILFPETLVKLTKEKSCRTSLWEKVEWTRPESPLTQAEIEKAVYRRLDVLRWAESFFGDEHPLGTGEQLDLIALEAAKLYPGKTEAQIKEIILSFGVSQGAFRKMRAQSAIKTAIKEREKQLV